MSHANQLGIPSDVRGRPRPMNGGMSRWGRGAYIAEPILPPERGHVSASWSEIGLRAMRSGSFL